VEYILGTKFGSLVFGEGAVEKGSSVLEGIYSGCMG
jgi:hypothetical protein